MIPFTRRELANAWRVAIAAAEGIRRSNAHRLLLFYAAECGLKAVYLRRVNKDVLEAQIAEDLKHDVNRMLTLVRAGRDLFLPDSYRLAAVRGSDGNSVPRNFGCSSLNQAWRYGGVLVQPTDSDVESKLQEINLWIAKEIA
jgi:hypothetical protein